MALEPVARVKALTLYPVKSMRGVPVSRATLYWYGFDGDRKYAFVQNKPRSSFPWLTAREKSDLLHYQPHFAQPEKPVTIDSELRLTTPSGRDLSLESSELREELELPESVSLLKLSRGTYDCMPVSILTTGMVKKLEERMGHSLDSRRFRSNILIETDEDLEDSLLGLSLCFGERDNSARVLTAYKTQRCQMINLDAETGASDPSILKEVAASFNACLGLYASVQTLGDIRVGDAVYAAPK